MGREFSFVTAMNIIAEVEKSEHKNDQNFLRNALGEETFFTFVSAGYINTGFTFHNNEIIDTYSVTQNYKDWLAFMEKIEEIEYFKPAE